MTIMTLGIIAAALIPAESTEEQPSVVLQIESTLDGALQPCLFIAARGTEPRPLLVGLHPWSHGYDTFDDMRLWQQQARARNWHYLQPHFRGPNKQPEACASPKARQDILDAVDYVEARYPVDGQRVYLAGVSGGGHMALVMAAHAPERWAGVSAWAAITDLAVWHRECRAAGRAYWQDIEACCGGAPGASEAVDREYAQRSPLTAIARAKELPLDIATGIHDGHTGSVPIHHSIDAFNAIAKAHGAAPVSVAEIDRLSQEKPLDAPQAQDPTFDRQIYLRRYAGPSRLTIFEGGHEMLPSAACDWLAQRARQQ